MARDVPRLARRAANPTLSVAVLEQLTNIVLAALAGWCLGYLSDLATDYFQRQDDLPLVAQGLLVRDLMVQVSCAGVWAVAPLLLDGPWWHWVAAGLIAVPLLQVAVTDLRHRYVYVAVAGVGIILGIA